MTVDAGGRPGSTPRRALVAVTMAFAFLGFSALVTEIATLHAQHRFNAGDFFSYFTVEANTLAVLSLVLSSFAAVAGYTGHRLELYRGAVTLYMTTTILIFIVLLSGYPASELTAAPWDNTVLHYIMPIVIMLDWLVAPVRAAVPYRTAVLWLAFPLAYLVYSLIRGSIVHWYPYPFMNLDARIPRHRDHLGGDRGDPGRHHLAGRPGPALVTAAARSLRVRSGSSQRSGGKAMRIRCAPVLMIRSYAESASRSGSADSSRQPAPAVTRPCSSTSIAW